MDLNMTRDLEHLDHRNGEKSLSCVWLFATPWTGAYQAFLPWDFPCKNTGVGYHFLFQEIYPTQGLNLGLPHSRLYHFTVWATREVWSWKAVIIPKRKRMLLSDEWGVDAGQLEANTSCSWRMILDSSIEFSICWGHSCQITSALIFHAMFAETAFALLKNDIPRRSTLNTQTLVSK